MNKYNMLVNCKKTNNKFLAYNYNDKVVVSNGTTILHKYFVEKYDMLKIFHESSYDSLITAWKTIQERKKKTHIYINNPVNHSKISVRLDDMRYKDAIIAEIQSRIKRGIHV